MSEAPFVSRTQRRIERRQAVLLIILVLAVTGVSFFLGVLVGQSGSLSAFGRRAESPRLPVAQIAPPPLPAAVTVPAGPQKMTFYDDLPKGNSAPLGSGINLPKTTYVPPPPAPVVAPVASVAATPPAPTPAAPKATPAPASPPAVKVPVASSGGAYVVQVAATKDQAEARRLVSKLGEKGFSASTERADLGAKGVWYRVVAGPYADRAAADKAAGQLKQQKFSAMVRAR